MITKVLAIVLIILGLTLGFLLGINYYQKKNWDLERLLVKQKLVSPAVEPSPELTSSIDDQVESLIDNMTVEEKVGQLFIVTLEELERGEINRSYFPKSINEQQKRNLSKYYPAGVIFFTSNVESAEQLSQYIDDLQAVTKYPLFIAVDEEGGSVSRLTAKSIGVTKFPPMRKIGESADPQQARQVGETLGRELRELGFNLDFAPVADVDTNRKNPVIGQRSFGSDPELVSQMVAAEVSGLQSQNVAAAIKHFPGHGDTQTDTHHGQVILDVDRARLDEVELLPFKAGIKAGSDLVLVAHINLPKITHSTATATLSPQIMEQMLRQELGFSGVIVTDAMDMAAITESYGDEAALRSIQAGADLILMPKNFPAAYQKVLEAVESGILSEERVDQSLRRILNVKLKREIIKN